MCANLIRVSWFAAVALFASTAAHAELQFAGYIRAGGGTRFVLQEAPPGENSEWLGLGDRFHGYTVTAFDARTETLTVTKADENIRLPLKAGALRSADIIENWTEAALLEQMEANRKRLAAINADLNERTRALEAAANNRGTSSTQQDLMKAWKDQLLLRNVLNELVQLQSDLVLFIQMRREEDENAIKTRARVTVLMQAMEAQDFRAVLFRQ